MPLTLPSLKALVLHSAGEMKYVGYGTFYLDSQLGVFVVCRIVMLTGTAIHTFMIQRREADKEEEAVEGIWLVVAKSIGLLCLGLERSTG